MESLKLIVIFILAISTAYVFAPADKNQSRPFVAAKSFKCSLSVFKPNNPLDAEAILASYEGPVALGQVHTLYSDQEHAAVLALNTSERLQLSIIKIADNSLVAVTEGLPHRVLMINASTQWRILCLP